MSWTNVPFKNPGDPVTAENWNGLVGNFTAMADAESGAPRILLPEAGRTTATDPQTFLSPNGVGGVRWTRPLLGLRYSDTVLTNLANGSWVAWGHSFKPITDEEPAETHHGFALLIDGLIVMESVINEAGFLIDGFSMANGTLRFMHDPFRSIRFRHLMAIRIG